MNYCCHGISKVSEYTARARSSKRCIVVYIIRVFPVDDKVLLLVRLNWTAMEGSINIHCCCFCVGRSVTDNFRDMGECSPITSERVWVDF